MKNYNLSDEIRCTLQAVEQQIITFVNALTDKYKLQMAEAKGVITIAGNKITLYGGSTGKAAKVDNADCVDNIYNDLIKLADYLISENAEFDKVVLQVHFVAADSRKYTVNVTGKPGFTTTGQKRSAGKQPKDQPAKAREKQPLFLPSGEKPQIKANKSKKDNDIALWGDPVDIETRTEKITGKYGIVRLSVLIPSHNPVNFSENKNYPANCQQRDYKNDPAEQRKVQKNAEPSVFNPKFLLAITPTATDGAPIVNINKTDQWPVLGGNSRVMTLNRTDDNTYALYKSALLSNAAAYGFNANDITDMFGSERIILIRAVQVDMNKCSTYSNILNKGLTQEVDPGTDYVAQSRQLTETQIKSIADTFDASDADTIASAMAETKVQRKLTEIFRSAGIITDQNISYFVNPQTGDFTPAGRMNIEGILLALIIPDKKQIEVAREYSGKILRALPLFMRIKAMPVKWRMTDNLRHVIQLELQRRVTKMPKDLFINQTSFDAPEIKESDIIIWNALDLGIKTFRTFVESYVSQADNEIEVESGKSMFSTQPRTYTEVLQSAYNKAAGIKTKPAAVPEVEPQSQPEPAAVPEVDTTEEPENVVEVENMPEESIVPEIAPEIAPESETIDQNLSVFDPNGDIERIAKYAWHGISFDREKRAQRFMDDEQKYIADLYKELYEEAQKNDTVETFIIEWTLFLYKYRAFAKEYLQKKSRTMSPMITGPARFPVDSNRKKMESEQKTLEAWIKYTDYRVKKIKRLIQKKSEEKQLSLQQQLDVLKRLKPIIKDVWAMSNAKPLQPQENAKSWDFSLLEKEFTNPEELKYAIERTKPYHFFTIAYITKDIRNLENQLKVNNRINENVPDEIRYNNALFVKNTGLDRFQFKFDSVPDQETRNLFKSNAYKWSPREKAWQRQITGNAYYNLTRVIFPFIEEKYGKIDDSFISDCACSVADIKIDKKKIVSAPCGMSDAASTMDLRKQKYAKMPLPTKYRELFGEVSPGFRALIWGTPGSGKSTLCTVFARDLAKRNQHKVLYISAEESINSATLAKRLKRFHAYDKNLIITNADTIDTIEQNIKTHRPKVVIFDSIQAFAKHNIADMINFINELATKHNISVITIAHSKKDGKNYSGIKDLGHYHDIVIRCSNFIAETQKNRFGNLHAQTIQGFK